MHTLQQESQPSNPAAGFLRTFAGTDGRMRVLDSSGNVSALAGTAIKDYRIIDVIEILQGTTTYTPKSTCSALFIEGWGAGGGGAGVAQATASQITDAVGGGGGGYSCVFLSGVNFVSGQATVQVGAGGAGGAAGANDGNTGTDTTYNDFGTTLRLTAKGGVKGTTANGLATGTTNVITGAGGAGGASGSGTGDSKWDGGASLLPGLRISGLIGYSGPGGSGANGGPGGAAVLASAAGNNGGFPGGGGSGAMDTGTAARAGGNGANGLLRIWELA